MVHYSQMKCFIKTYFRMLIKFLHFQWVESIIQFILFTLCFDSRSYYRYAESEVFLLELFAFCSLTVNILSSWILNLTFTLKKNHFWSAFCFSILLSTSTVKSKDSFFGVALWYAIEVLNLCVYNVFFIMFLLNEWKNGAVITNFVEWKIVFHRILLWQELCL